MKRVRRGLTLLVVVAVAAGAAVFAQPPKEASSAEGKAMLPLAWTMPAKYVTNTEAFLFGRFNPRGSRTVIQFQYGPTKSYGHVHPGFAPKALSTMLRGVGLDVQSAAITSRERKKPHFEVVSAFARKPPARSN